MAPSDREINPPQGTGSGQRRSNLGGANGDASDPGRGIPPRYDDQGNTMDPLAAFHSIITANEAVTQTIRQVTDELRLAADAARQYQSQSRQAMTGMTQAMQQMLQNIQSAAATTAQNTGAGPGGAGRGGGRPGGPLPRPGNPHPPAGGGTGGGGQGGPGGGAPAPASPNPTQAQRDASRMAMGDVQYNADGSIRDNGPNTRAGLRRRAATALHNNAGLGTRRRPTLLPQYDANGDISHYELQHPDGTREHVARNSRRIPGLLADDARQTTVSGIAQGFARGGLGGAARAVPYLGTAMAVGEVADQALTWTAEQQKQNSYYQSIYGGSKLGTGINNRLGEEAFTWSNKLGALSGGLDEQDARAAYRGVSSLGFQGSQKSNSLSFIEDAYKNLGVDVQTSLKLVQQSASGANSSLAGVSSALNSVGQMAVATSQNANVLYQAFSNNYQTTLAQGFGGQAASIAAGLTGASAGQGRDLSTIDYSKLNDFSMHQRLAQQAGMPFSKLVGQAEIGNTKPYTQALDKLDSSWTKSILGNMPPAAQGVLASAIAKAGGASAVANSEGARQSIATQLLNSGINIDMMQSQYQATSGENVQSLNPQAFAELMVSRYVNPNAVTNSTQKAQDQFNQTPVSDFQKKFGGFGGSGIASPDSYVSSNWGLNIFDGGAQQKNSVLAAYGDRVAQSGQHDPVIQSLIDKVGATKETGIQVQTGNGQKVVSQEDAVRFYADQLAQGSATLVGGQYDGQTVQDLVGGKESNYSGPNSTGDTTDHGGVTVDQWKKDNPTAQSDAQAATGTVTISMTPQLAQFFQLSTTGSAKYDAAAQGSVPPTLSGGLPQ